MDINDRADLFAEYVGLALKGKITQYGWTISGVAKELGHGPTAMTNWLNSKRGHLPLRILDKVCELIDIEPQDVVREAYERLVKEYGDYDKPLTDFGSERPPFEVYGDTPELTERKAAKHNPGDAL